MKTIKTVPITPEYITYVPEKMGQGILYISREFETALHLCLCGCGNEVVTPLSENGWILTESKGKVSLYPSIGNYSLPCRSHYVITQNKANFI